MRYRQYEIVIVSLDPTIGTEIKKTRPCVVISPKEMNYSNIIVAPMTSKQKDYPTRIKVDEGSYIVLDQIRTISTKRVVKRTGRVLDKETIQEIKRILKIMLID